MLQDQYSFQIYSKLSRENIILLLTNYNLVKYIFINYKIYINIDK